MSQPVYFGVVRAHGRDSPRRFFDEVPRCYIEKERRQELIYCTRLDTLPNGDAMVNAPLDHLMRVYRTLKGENKLPPQNRGRKPKPPEGTTTPGFGDRWEPPPPTWDQWAPFADDWIAAKA